ncbi:hypothetical protein KKC1_16610 [Calderihabitans maritimus]|uniref:Uncharacterized protein n=1 Tax=Calderihabitans maritimus TaxID=1246530 RepID=A0A1Z5HT26_9FIRM|nr:hypothetical protein KKC1_16610 [Calderihabitans maritimus]
MKLRIDGLITWELVMEVWACWELASEFPWLFLLRQR